MPDGDGWRNVIFVNSSTRQVFATCFPTPCIAFILCWRLLGDPA
jgi:hypothetical protein